MKYFGSLFMLLLVCASSQTLRAQTADSWVSVQLAGEELTVQLPKDHQSAKIQDLNFDRFKLDGNVYTATEDGVDYSVWSLVDKGGAQYDPASYIGVLDYCADLVWESLLKPRRDQLPEDAKAHTRMSYAGELNWPSLQVNKNWYMPRGREYSIMLGSSFGKTQFYAAGQQIYIIAVLNENANSTAAQRFVNSFRVKKEVDPKLPPVGNGGGFGPLESGGIGPGRGGNAGGGDRIPSGGASSAAGSIDYNKVFSGKDVIQKARITSKPEPSYTESARKYAVTGTVVLRAVFSSSGEVIQIRAISGLPHGLTGKAVQAAKGIKFTPATKDGHNVSMWYQLEYNFNLY